MKRNHANELKIIWALVIALLIGIVAHAQDFCVTFQHPTNSAKIISYELYATDATNGWKGQSWCFATTNKILFKSWNLPKNPCQLAVRSVGEISSSELSVSINFDTRDYVAKTNVPTPLPNPVLPPTFLLIEKL